MLVKKQERTQANARLLTPLCWTRGVGRGQAREGGDVPEGDRNLRCMRKLCMQADPGRGNGAVLHREEVWNSVCSVQMEREGREASLHQFACISSRTPFHQPNNLPILGSVGSV